MKRFIKTTLATLVAVWPLLLMPMPAHAITCTWTGTTSNLWSVSTNWSGCGGGTPGAGDTLSFPLGGLNPSMNNDLAVLTFNTVNVNGNGYTFGGGDINISNNWQFAGTGNTVSVNINYINAGSTSMTIANGATGNVIDGNIDLALTASGDMNLDVNEDINHNGAITGSTDGLQQVGDSTWITSTTNVSTFTAPASVNVASGYFQCRNNNCFGANANDVSNNSGGALQFNNGGGLTVANNIALGSSSSPQLNIISGTIVLTGTFTVNAGGTVYVQTAALFVNGAITLNSDLYTNGTSAAVSSINLNGNIAGASTGNVNVDNTLTTFGGVSPAYNGVITALPGSVIEAFSADSFGSVVGNTIIQSGATLYSNSTISVAEPLNVVGTGEGTGS